MMIVQIIGWFCLANAAIAQFTVMISGIQQDNIPAENRIRVMFLVVANLAVAAWCFK